jgi:serine/threonine protein kinase
MTRTLKSGRYSIEGTLGAGSQGETLDALDTERNERVAIKRFSVRGAASWKDVELAEREARVLSAIAHPKLPRYVDHFEENGSLFLVMERVEGESLAALRRRGGALSRTEIVRLLADLGEVLDYLHGRAPPIIHRDIKPGNVFRRPDGSFALVDFGSVRDSLKPEGGSTVVGTFGFMAPEQFQGRALPQSDVYALAATALALLTGRDPEDLPHRGLRIDVWAALPHDPAFARALERMLEPDPDRRAARVTPLVAELHAAGASGGAEFSGSGPASASSTREKSLLTNPLVILLVLVALFIARISTGVVFRFLVPVLLTVLSIALGGGLRRAATRMRQSAERTDQGMKRAIEIVRGHPPERPQKS